MALQLKDILLKKYRDDQLAQVYLLRYQNLQAREEWLNAFFKSITPLSDHPDILWVRRGPKENEYKVDSDSIKALYQFLNFKAFELSKKFIIIEDAHLLSVIVSNKLLKILEELPENFCLFLLAPKDESLLPTVESRAIKIALPESTQVHLENASTEFAGPQEMLLELKKSENPELIEKQFVEESLNRTLKSLKFSECEKALEDLRNFRVSAAFNNSKASRLSPFFP
jgi:DNA polymerase III subunit delta'